MRTFFLTVSLLIGISSMCMAAQIYKWVDVQGVTHFDAQPPQDQQAQLKAFCEQARTNLAQLQNNPRIREDVEGEMRRLTDQQRQARISEAQKQIADNCQ
ncbi:DUF4124 domain-containing protein [Pseudomonas sp. Ma2-10]